LADVVEVYDLNLKLSTVKAAEDEMMGRMKRSSELLDLIASRPAPSMMKAGISE